MDRYFHFASLFTKGRNIQTLHWSIFFPPFPQLNAGQATNFPTTVLPDDDKYGVRGKGGYRNPISSRVTPGFAGGEKQWTHASSRIIRLAPLGLEQLGELSSLPFGFVAGITPRQTVNQQFGRASIWKADHRKNKFNFIFLLLLGECNLDDETCLSQVLFHKRLRIIMFMLPFTRKRWVNSKYSELILTVLFRNKPI